MTVADLILALQKMPPTSLVILSIDTEGNGFRPLDELGEGNYDDYHGYESREFIEDIMTAPVNAVCLWPE